MPIHDWSRVRAGRFHHFHNSWIYKLSDRLNAGLLPPGFYSAGEQILGDIEPDVLALKQEHPLGEAALPGPGGAAVAVSEHPPRVSHVAAAEEDAYLRKQDHVVVRSAESDQIVALVEIISPGNKDSRHRFEQLLRKVAAALTRGYHLLIIDLHRPGTFDPDGIHAAIWEYLFGQSDAPPDDRPLTLVSYCAAPAPTAYVEPVGVGDILPEMPLFLDADWYVDVPLESTYLETWEGFPGPWKADLTGT
jgi:hypothetical protein